MTIVKGSMTDWQNISSLLNLGITDRHIKSSPESLSGLPSFREYDKILIDFGCDRLVNRPGIWWGGYDKDILVFFLCVSFQTSCATSIEQTNGTIAEQTGYFSWRWCRVSGSWWSFWQDDISGFIWESIFLGEAFSLRQGPSQILLAARLQQSVCNRKRSFISLKS